MASGCVLCIAGKPGYHRSIGGGFAPLIIASLYKSYNSTLAVSLYVCVALSITLIALICARETAGKPLEK
jgi:hypothetical protein